MGVPNFQGWNGGAKFPSRVHNFLGYLEWGCQISWDAKYPVTLDECLRLILLNQLSYSRGCQSVARADYTYEQPLSEINLRCKQQT